LPTGRAIGLKASAN